MRYVVVPRVLGCLIMLPIMVIFSVCFSIISSFITVVLFVDYPLAHYVATLGRFFTMKEVWACLVKSLVFGFVVGVVGAHQGLDSVRGARGVGEATSKSIMHSCAIVLLLDFILTLIFTV
jgi:phospholipid/cholesterol/gamma-HCH transport system permease protein